MTKWKQFPNVIMAVTVPSFPPLLLPQYRYAKLEQPSQFGGQACNFHGREEEACAVSSRYTCDNVPVCEGFLCATTGRPNLGFTPSSVFVLGRIVSLFSCAAAVPSLRPLHSQNSAVQRRGRLRGHVRRSWLQEGSQTLQVGSRGVLGNREPGQRVSPRCAEGCQSLQIRSLRMFCALESTYWTVT